MIKIPNEIVQQLYGHGRSNIPIEACGYLAGTDNTVQKFYPMTNIDQSREHFSLDPKEQFQVIREARTEGLNVIAVYHSHPETPARPSQEDIKLAFDPNVSYVIVSLATEPPVIKSFKIQNNEVTVEDVEII